MTDKHLGGHGALLVAYIIFGLNVPIMKSVLTDGNITPTDMAFFRLAGAMLLFWLASIFMPKERVSRGDMFQLFLASVCGIFLCQFLFSIGLARTSPIDAAVINSIGPVMTMILAAFFLKEPITWKKALGVLIGISGALLLIFSNKTPDNGNPSLVGNLIILASTLSFVIYLTAFKPLISRYMPVTVMKWMFLYATLCILPFSWHDISTLPYSAVATDVWLRALYVVLMATFISYFLLPIGQKYLRPTIVSMYNYVQPIVSSLVAVAVGMDILSWQKGVAALLVFSGVYIVTQSKSRAQIAAEKERNKAAKPETSA